MKNRELMYMPFFMDTKSIGLRLSFYCNLLCCTKRPARKTNRTDWTDVPPQSWFFIFLFFLLSFYEIKLSDNETYIQNSYMICVDIFNDNLWSTLDDPFSKQLFLFLDKKGLRLYIFFFEKLVPNYSVYVFFHLMQSFRKFIILKW